MRQFKVFKHPTGEFQVVKHGWCWPAFLFTFVWAMVARMWGLGVGLLVALLVLGLASDHSGVGDGADGLGGVASIIASVVLGFKDNAWRQKKLLQRGFELKDTVAAANKDSALALFIRGASPAQS